MKYLTKEQLSDITERTMNSFMLALAQNDEAKMQLCTELLNTLAELDGDIYDTRRANSKSAS